MNLTILQGFMIPFLGMALGAGCVFPAKRAMNDLVRRALEGFASGVMVAASIWSLIIPAIEQSAELGSQAFFPAAISFWVGILFLLLLDRLTPHLHFGASEAEGPSKRWQAGPAANFASRQGTTVPGPLHQGAGNLRCGSDGFIRKDAQPGRGGRPGCCFLARYRLPVFSGRLPRA